MIAIALPWIVFLIVGPMFTLILISSYFLSHVLIYVTVIIIVNAMVMRQAYLSQRKHETALSMFQLNPEFEQQNEEKGKQEINFIFLTSTFTSWCLCH